MGIGGGTQLLVGTKKKCCRCPGYLCPPVPQRVDYLHVMADLLQQTLYEDVVPDVVANQPPVHIRGLRGLDIGTGAGDGYIC